MTTRAGSQILFRSALLEPLISQQPQYLRHQPAEWNPESSVNRGSRGGAFWASWLPDRLILPDSSDEAVFEAGRVWSWQPQENIESLRQSSHGGPPSIVDVTYSAILRWSSGNHVAH